MTDEQKQAIQLLKGYASLNDGHGPVVPRAIAQELRKLGITHGFVEQNKLPIDPG